MKQLELTKQQLEQMGFIKKIIPADEMNKEIVQYRLKFINGYFAYKENIDYRWYCTTKVFRGVNSVSLNIQSFDRLFTVLSTFKIKYNYLSATEQLVFNFHKCQKCEKEEKISTNTDIEMYHCPKCNERGCWDRLAF